MSLQTSASADVVYYIFATIPSSSYHHHGSSSNILALASPSGSWWSLDALFSAALCRITSKIQLGSEQFPLP